MSGVAEKAGMDKMQETMGRQSALLIDAHNHVGGPDISDKKSQSGSEIIKALDSTNVDRAVIFPFNNPDPSLGFKFANDYIADVVSDYPDQLIGFGRVDPTNVDRALKEVERLSTDLGLVGLKLHPRAQQFYPDDGGLHKVLTKASKLGLVVVFDSGSDFAPWSGMAEMAKQFSEVPMIMAHMRKAGYIEAAKSASNIYLGTTKVQPELIVEAVQQIGADRIISGSDSPYVSIQAEYDKIMSLNQLSVGEKDQILGLNMARILNIDK